MFDQTTKDMLIDFINSEYADALGKLSAKNDVFEVNLSASPIVSDVICDKGGLEDFSNLVLFVAQGNNIPITTIRVKVIELEDFTKVRKLATRHIGKLVKIRGIINSATEIRPMYVVARFKCRECGWLSPDYPQDTDKLISPARCGDSGCKSPLIDISPEDSDFVDSQELRMQEIPDDTPSGQTPRNVKIFIKEGDLIQKAKCGDIVEIVGIIRVEALRERGAKTKYTRVYVEANNIVRKSKEPEAVEISDEDIKSVEELSKKPNVINILIDSLAPALDGLEDVKEAAVYLLFGGVDKKMTNNKIRGTINILIVGDPSTGKTQILQAVANVAPLGIYASGRGATAAGLTAAVVRDSTDHFTLEAGVMVLADKGIACIDEIDKMRPEDRVAMHEALEQQTVSIHKGDIHQILNARASVFAAGNPTLGKYDTYKTVKENLSNLPEPLFSRFDLIFITKDTTEFDERRSKHVLDIQREENVCIERTLFQKYISYAKRIKPKLTAIAKSKINEFYVNARSAVTNDSIGITLRQLESLIRIAEAHARIRLSEEVTEEDANIAIELFKKAMEQVGVNQIEGKSKRTIRGKAEIMLSVLYQERERNELIEIMQNEHQVLPSETGKILSRLLMEGKVMEVREGHYLKV